VDGKVLHRPEGFPLSRAFVQTDTTFTAKYNCESILDWFYARHYIDYNADSLFAQRSALIGQMNSGQQQFASFLKFGDDMEGEFGSDSEG
jgi:hypothetical protein